MIHAREQHALTDQERDRIEHIDALVARGAIAIGDLVAGLDDPSWTVRRAIVGALAAFGDPAVGPLLIWLTDRRSSERAIAAAVDSLVASVGDVTAAAQVLLVHPRPPVAADGAAILGRRRDVRAVPMLAVALAHADDNVAMAAIEALGAIGGSVAIEPLIGVVRARNFFRTFPALQVLARSGDPRAIAPIAELLDDPAFRDEAARALGRTGTAQAIAPLVNVLARGGLAEARLVATALADLFARARWTGAFDAVRTTARSLLAPVRATLVAALPDASAEERAAIAQLLGEIGDATTVAALAPLLRDTELRSVAIDAIQRLGTTSEDALRAALGDPDPALRSAALPAVQTARVAPEVRALLADDDPEVRARACEALARIQDTTALSTLFALLADPNPRVAQAATSAIHSLGSADTAALVLGALRSPLPLVRRQALRIVAYLGCDGTFDAVRALTADADNRIAELAVVALGALADPRVDAALEELARTENREALRGAAMRAAGVRDTERSFALLESGVTDTTAWVRYYACQGLGKRAVPASSTLLVGRLTDPAPHVRIAAIDALALLDAPHAWQALTTAARSSDPDAQRAALVGLGLHGKPAALPYLIAAECSDDVATRLIALAGLARQDDPSALAALRNAALGAVPELRDAALSLLAERTDRAAGEALVEAALTCPADHPVHFALSRPGPARIAAITRRLGTASGATAVPLAAALARMADPAAIAALIDILSSGPPEARRAAAAAVIATGAPGARDAVARRAVEDPDPEVRKVCAAASAV